jgi:hypothetical protein
MPYVTGEFMTLETFFDGDALASLVLQSRITEATVKAHLTHIFQKLMLRGRGKLAALYHQGRMPLAAKGTAGSANDPCRIS